MARLALATLSIALTCTALPAQPADPGFPLGAGARWEYVRDGEEALVLEVEGQREKGGVDATTLRVRGPSFFWTTRELFLVQREGLLLSPAHGYGNDVFRSDPPQVLVEAPLADGDAWTSTSHDRHGSEFSFRVEVAGPEAVTVPAGSFQAFVLTYTLVRHLGTEYDLRGWFVPGTGFVKLERWQRSRMGVKQAVEPIVVELAAFWPEGRPGTGAQALTSPEQKGAARHLAELADPRERVRARALAQLRALGPGAAALAHELWRETPAGEHRARLRAFVQEHEQLTLLATARKREIAPGERLPLRLALRNDSPFPVPVLPSLDASDVGWRFPRITIAATGPDGAPVEVEEWGRCGNVNPLQARDFVELAPGQELSVLGPGSFDHYFLHLFRPETPGAYTVRCTYDTTGSTLKDWTTFDGPPGADAQALLEWMPRVELVAAPVVFEVVAGK